MMESLSKLIKEVAEDKGIGVRTNYSGRGMYGKRCMAVTGALRDCMDVIAGVLVARQEEVLWSARELGDRDEPVANQEQAAMENQLERETLMLLNYDYDSMGLGMVIYWPRIQYDDGDEE